MIGSESPSARTKKWPGKEILEEQLVAAKAGDEEAVRVLHEAVGRLIEQQ